MFEFTNSNFRGKSRKGVVFELPFFFGALNFASHVAILSTMPTTGKFVIHHGHLFLPK